MNRGIDSEAAKRARLRAAGLLDDLLPDTTSDEREPGDTERERSADERLRRDVPPHYGRD